MAYGAHLSLLPRGRAGSVGEACRIRRVYVRKRLSDVLQTEDLGRFVL
jgi:hypothetical protein